VAEALPGFFSHLTHLQVMSELLCPPCADYGACQEAVKQCFGKLIMANCRCIGREKDAQAIFESGNMSVFMIWPLHVA